MTKPREATGSFDEIYLVELPFKAKHVDSKGANVTSLISQLQKSSKTLKITSASGLTQNVCSDIKLA